MLAKVVRPELGKGLGRVIAFPSHRVRRRASALVFAPWGDFEAQRRAGAHLLAACAAFACALTGVAILAVLLGG
jgi:hypothetical protein